MDSQTLERINDLRGRVVKARAFKVQGEAIPDGLMPSDEELREALRALRTSRQTATTTSRAKATTKNGGIDQNFDLNSLF